jgi:hypothetical protein
MFGMPAEWAFFGLVAAGVSIGLLGFQILVDRDRETIKLYPPDVECPFCGKVKHLRIAKACSQVSRLEGCEIQADHQHVNCENCKAEFVQRARRWYD